MAQGTLTTLWSDGRLKDGVYLVATDNPSLVQTGLPSGLSSRVLFVLFRRLNTEATYRSCFIFDLGNSTLYFNTYTTQWFGWKMITATTV